MGGCPGPRSEWSADRRRAAAFAQTSVSTIDADGNLADNVARLVFSESGGCFLERIDAVQVGDELALVEEALRAISIQSVYTQCAITASKKP